MTASRSPRSHRRLVTASVLAVAAAGASVVYVAGRPDAEDPLAPRRAAEAVDAPTNLGIVRPTAVVLGATVTVAGRNVLTTTDTSATMYGPDGRALWSRPAVGRRGATSTPDGRAVVLRSEGVVTVLDAATGAVRWRRDVAGDDRLDVGAEGVVVGRAGPGGTEAFEVLDPADGTLRRLVPAPCPGSVIVGADPLTLACGSEGRLSVFGPSGDRPTWQGPYRNSDPGFVALGGGLVIVTDEGGPQVVDSTTGTARFRLTPGFEAFSPRSPGDGTVIVLLDGDEVVRLDPEDGHELSRVTLEGFTRATPAGVPALVGSRVLVVSAGLPVEGAGPFDRRAGVVAWDVATGELVERSSMGPTASDPYEGDLVAVGDGVAALQANLVGTDGTQAAHTVVLTIG